MVRVGRRKNTNAFDELVGRWDRRVLAFLTKATGDPEAAKDLRQEVFVRVYRYAGTYDPGYAFTTWLFRIVSNVRRTWSAKRGRVQAFERASDDAGLPDAADPAPGPSDCAAQSERADRLRAAIARLPDGDRELVLLRMDVELSYREIGEVLGAPETTVKSRFYAILARLRQSLDDAGLSERSAQG